MMKIDNNSAAIANNNANEILLNNIAEYRDAITGQALLDALQHYLKTTQSLSRVSKLQFAEQSNLSTRSVSRQLKKLKTSYQRQLTIERKRRCHIILNATNITGARLSSFLGFASPSNFYLWFQKNHAVAFSEFVLNQERALRDNQPSVPKQ